MAQQDLSNSQLLSIKEVSQSFAKTLAEDENRSEFMSSTQSANNNHTRVKLCYEYLHRHGLLPKEPSVSKNDGTSSNFKEKGDQCFLNKDDNKALACYNFALKYASDSKMKTLIYASRSAVSFSKKNYKQCLLDIERIFEAGYDGDLKSELLDRKAQCEETLLTLENLTVKDDLSLEEARKLLFTSPKEHSDGVPCASASIKIHNFGSMGRGIIATEDILPGQVLVKEKPFASVLDKKYFMSRCYFCCNPNSSMIACESCSVAMFCNESCRSNSWNEGHKYECPLMPHVVNMDFIVSELLSLRVLLKARCQHTSLSDMFESIDLVDKETVPELKGFTLNSDNKPIYDSNSYAPIHVMDTHAETVSYDTICYLCVLPATFLHMLVKYTTFFDNPPEDILALDDNDYIWRVGDLLLHIMMSSMYYEGRILTADLREIPRKIEVGLGSYAVMNLFNHSCSPNIGRVYLGSTVVGLAVRPIKKGEQIFITYGPRYSTMERSVRHRRLAGLYKFMCRCEACIDRWPMIPYLRNAKFNSKLVAEKINQLTRKDVEKTLGNGDKKAAYAILKELHKYMCFAAKYTPSQEYNNIEYLTTLCWEFFGNNEYVH